MAHVEIFDPAMCCSTGVCGTDVDPALSRFAADVAWLSGRGVEVDRATLAQEPTKFVANDAVRQALEADGTSALPMVLVDGTVKAKGAYPTRQDLATWTGFERTALPLSEVVAAQAPAEACWGGSGCC
ncbi:arsenite efflux transporter metallochaperone ArsD [Demequina sp. TTPB684]|uniref:arsenite efflux transporter metallochaperone ArsD n=1 Tax=unclassified Demequina TaxID=2620311 RepID=UPI001CF3672C|nr:MULTISPECIES: arsenite efflux transporter metallochaperone ArsD [unclassified Demequina]MCB2412561.1 arsenite efflux transporter metallochaperone ArsD [Demequina sp. TTPB684]UPU87818.1 arsenite efflux transporter metallochaperone ArsD [Demequina sp. TMPB413]